MDAARDVREASRAEERSRDARNAARGDPDALKIAELALAEAEKKTSKAVAAYQVEILGETK
jgi:hypothetical protein